MGTTLVQMNLWAESIANAAWPMLWQSSVLIALLLTLDHALKKRLRASVRYTLWLVLLVKLVLPPTLAMPTGVAWWVRESSVVAAGQELPFRSVVVRYGMTMPPQDGLETAPKAVSDSRVVPTRTAWIVLFSVCVSVGLFAW